MKRKLIVLLFFALTLGVFASGSDEESGPSGKIPKKVGWLGNYMMHEW